MRPLLLLLAFSLLALALYTLVLCSDESLYTHRGTYACWVCISSTIRNVPEVGHTQKILFYSSSGDGSKPPENAVTYFTDASTDTVSRKLAQYFRHREIPVSFSSEQVDRAMPSTGQPFVEALIQPAGNRRTQVTVKQTF